MKGYYITSTDLKPVVFGITPYPPTPPSLLVFMISHLPPLWGFLLVYGNGLSTPGQSVPTRVFFFFYESLGSGRRPDNGEPEELVLWHCPPIHPMAFMLTGDTARKTHRESSRKFLRATRRKQHRVEACSSLCSNPYNSTCCSRQINSVVFFLFFFATSVSLFSWYTVAWNLTWQKSIM